MRLTSFQKLMAVVGAIALAAIVAIMLLIVPQFTALSQLSTDQQSAEADVAQTRTQLAQLEQAKEAAAVTQSQLLKLSNEFPDSPDLPSLIIELQDVANASGLRFNEITPAEPITIVGAKYTQIPITVKLWGGWADMLDYLQRLNHMTRAIRVSDVQLTPALGNDAPTSTAEPELEGDLTMRAFVMAVPTGTSSGTPAVPGASTAPVRQ